MAEQPILDDKAHKFAYPDEHDLRYPSNMEFLAGGGLILGILFKLMQWPNATLILYIAGAAFVLFHVVAPFYLIMERKLPKPFSQILVVYGFIIGGLVTALGLQMLRGAVPSEAIMACTAAGLVLLAYMGWLLKEDWAKYRVLSPLLPRLVILLILGINTSLKFLM